MRGKCIRVTSCLLCSLFLLSCSTAKKISIEGRAQGTTYHITYYSKDSKSYQKEVDSLLRQLDLSLSTYVPTSLISRVNQNDADAVADQHFTTVFNKAREVSVNTGGSFDVTVAPLINAYGFGFTKREKVNAAMIDSLLRLVSYKRVRLEGGKIIKDTSQIMLDFNAIAQGYSVDVLAYFFDSKKIHNYLVELGGEVKASGRKEKRQPWKVGIDQPNEDPYADHALKAVVILRDKALATSGNYTKFYEEDGQRYAHIINPTTGLPSKHNLVSASVIANDCMTADAYATAFMVMGMEKAIEFLATHRELNLDVYFILDDHGAWKTYSSEGLKQWMQEY